MASRLTPFFQGILSNPRHLHPRVTDSYVVFAEPEASARDGALSPFYVWDFAAGARHDCLLPEAARASLTRCVLPPVAPEPSAGRLAYAAADACWPDLRGAALIRAAEEELWHGAPMAVRPQPGPRTRPRPRSLSPAAGAGLCPGCSPLMMAARH